MVKIIKFNTGNRWCPFHILKKEYEKFQKVKYKQNDETARANLTVKIYGTVFKCTGRPAALAPRFAYVEAVSGSSYLRIRSDIC